MMKATGTLMGLALAFTISTSSAIAAPACPEVDSARAMLAQAAAKQNERELQAPRDQGQGAQPKDRQGAAPEAGKQDTVPPQMKRAALLVKDADTACQAGNTAEAAEKAKAAIGLMQQ